jgi:c(7)-type cytochrome triheme protein
MQAKGLDLAWQRVYDYPPQAHVRFEHAPHIRAKVDCATCHGDMRQQSVAQRMVDMDMGFCVNCHKQRQASNDCLTCHY